MAESNNKQEYTKFQEEGQTEQIEGKVLLKVKRLDGTNLEIYADLKHTIKDFKEEHFQEEIQQNKVIKLIYRGRLLKDDESIEMINFPEGSFIHVSITGGNPDQANQNKNSDSVAINIDQQNNDQQQQGEQAQPQQDGTVPQNSNLSEQEMNNLRQFLAISRQQQDGAAQMQPDANNYDQQAREEINRGNQLDILVGFLLGFSFMLPGILFVFFCNFSQKARFGAFMGFSMRLLYTILFSSGSHSSTSSEGSNNRYRSRTGEYVGTGAQFTQEDVYGFVYSMFSPL